MRTKSILFHKLMCFVLIFYSNQVNKFFSFDVIIELNLKSVFEPSMTLQDRTWAFMSCEITRKTIVLFWFFLGKHVLDWRVLFVFIFWGFLIIYHWLFSAQISYYYHVLKSFISSFFVILSCYSKDFISSDFVILSLAYCLFS